MKHVSAETCITYETETVSDGTLFQSSAFETKRSDGFVTQEARMQDKSYSLSHARRRQEGLIL